MSFGQKPKNAVSNGNTLKKLQIAHRLVPGIQMEIFTESSFQPFTFLVFFYFVDTLDIFGTLNREFAGETVKYG